MPGVRVDTGVRDGSEISVYYDSMVAKIIAWGTDRPAAIDRLATTLAETRVAGVKTNLPLLRLILTDEAYRAGDTTTRFLEERADHVRVAAATVPNEIKLLVLAALAASERGWRLGGVGIPFAGTIEGEPLAATLDRAGSGWRANGGVTATFEVEVRGNALLVRHDGRTLTADVAFDTTGGRITHDGRMYHFAAAAPPDADAEHHGGITAGSGTIISPMPGKIVSVAVREGDLVEPRALLIVLEAMKMEHRIEAPLAGTVRDVRVAAGDLVTGGATLVTIGA
jgi:acetyl/propionyl-CoA carboxylase alpha subunit